jgi:5-methylcytosine-specific restriction protein A
MISEPNYNKLTKDDFIKILEDSEITFSEDIFVLKIIYSFDKHRCSAKDIAIFLGKKSHAPYNIQFARMVKRISQKFDININVRKNQKYKYYSVLFDGEQVNNKFEWTIKPELVAAMEELDLIERPQSDSRLPEELLQQGESSYPEGMKKIILVNKYERNPDARKKCLSYYGTVCSVCHFDFEKVYGKLGKGYIHVHHLTPLSCIGKEYNLDPIRDLRPICPNCHAMIHRGDIVLGIEELRENMQNN